MLVLQRWVSGSLYQENLELFTRWSTQLTGSVMISAYNHVHKDFSPAEHAVPSNLTCVLRHDCINTIPF